MSSFSLFDELMLSVYVFLGLTIAVTVLGVLETDFFRHPRKPTSSTATGRSPRCWRRCRCSSCWRSRTSERQIALATSGATEMTETSLSSVFAAVILSQYFFSRSNAPPTNSPWVHAA